MHPKVKHSKGRTLGDSLRRDPYGKVIMIPEYISAMGKSFWGIIPLATIPRSPEWKSRIVQSIISLLMFHNIWPSRIQNDHECYPDFQKVNYSIGASAENLKSNIEDQSITSSSKYLMEWMRRTKDNTAIPFEHKLRKMGCSYS